MKVDSYEEKIESLEKEVSEQREDIVKLKSVVEGMEKYEVRLSDSHKL